MLKTFTVALGLVLLAATADAQSPAFPEQDRVRIAEAMRLANKLGNRIWPDWDKAPFAVLLVTRDHEYLIHHPKPSDDFKALGKDAILNENVWMRKRQFSPNLLATFPAVGGVPTIVIGQAESTSSNTSTRWVITLLHEHFHQLQMSQSRYYAELDSLKLAGSDKSGMWMLNYPFPYEDAKVKDQFATMAKLLADALHSRQTANFDKELKLYLDAKKKFRSLVSARDYKYLAFQTWQEGIARYTEYQVASLAAKDYEPTKAFKSLKDFMPFEDEAKRILVNIEKELRSVQLDKSKRVAFYALGAAEGLVLDVAKPDWRKRYFTEKFSLDGHSPK